MMELTPDQKALLAAAATIAQTVASAANPAVGAGVTAVVAILTSMSAKSGEYTMDDFNAAVVMDDAVSLQQGQASVEARRVGS